MTGKALNAGEGLSKINWWWWRRRRRSKDRTSTQLLVGESPRSTMGGHEADAAHHEQLELKPSCRDAPSQVKSRNQHINNPRRFNAMLLVQSQNFKHDVPQSAVDADLVTSRSPNFADVAPEAETFVVMSDVITCVRASQTTSSRVS